jgi:hypothetical protein
VALKLVSSSLVWFAIYFFTFEMKVIECALEGASEKEVEEKAKKTQKVKWTFIFTLILVVGPLYATIETILSDNN